MFLLETKLLGLPFGIAALDELLKTGLLEPDAVYRRREIVDALRSRFIELGVARRRLRSKSSCH